MSAVRTALVCLVVVTVTNHSYICEAASVSGQLLENSTDISNGNLSNVAVNTTDLSTPAPIDVVAVLSTDNVTEADGIAEGKLKTNHDDDDEDDDDDDDHREHDDDDDDDDDDKKKKLIKKILKKKNKGGAPTVLSITETIVDVNETTTKRPCPLGHRPTFGGNGTLDEASNVTSADQLSQGTALEKISESIVHALGTIKNSVTSIFVPGTGLPSGDGEDLDCLHNKTLRTNSTGNGTDSLPISLGEGASANLTNVPVDSNVTTTELPLVNASTTLSSVADGEIGNLTTTLPSTSTEVPLDITNGTSTVGTTSEAPIEAGAA